MTDRQAHVGGTVGKAVLLLDIVESFQAPVRFNEILKHSPFPKPSTYRLLQSLVNEGLLSHNSDSGQYVLGSRLIRLAYSAWRHASMAPIAAPYLDALSEKIGETLHLAQLDNGHVLYLDKRNAQRPLPMFSDAGKIGPAYCTGIGKAMLAFLEPEQRERCLAQQSFYRHTEHTVRSAEALRLELNEIRHLGVAYDREEHERSVICIAAPVLTSAGQLLGGLSITNSTSRSDLEALAAYEDDLKTAAKNIAEHAAVWLLPKLGG